MLITGLAGTGKTTLLRELLARHGSHSAVLAPTGVAAVQIGGQTIHRFLRLPPSSTVDEAEKPLPYLRDVLRRLRYLFVDEVSMVRADLWDCLEARLRTNGPRPGVRYGGIKVICFGDLFQLPPVVREEERAIFRDYYRSEFFFDARALSDNCLEIVELTRIFRQSDETFIDALNAIRVDDVKQEHLDRLNDRTDSDFAPRSGELYITITPTNRVANLVNEAHMTALRFDAVDFEGKTSGDVKTDYLPTSSFLNLKVGAQVMFVNNDSFDRWINGTLGTVVHLPTPGRKHDDADPVLVRLQDGTVVDVESNQWQFSRLDFDATNGKLVRVPVGEFEQLPLRLAWAVTIHKSQGLTFDRVIIDLANGTFASGQLYVALSRCRTLEGIALRRKIRRRDVIVDRRIVEFTKSRLVRQSESRFSVVEKLEQLRALLGQDQDVRVDYVRENGLRVRLLVRFVSIEERVLNGDAMTLVRVEAAGQPKPLLLDVRRILDINGRLLSR